MIDERDDADELPPALADELATQLRPQWPAPDRASALRARVLAAVAATRSASTSGTSAATDTATIRVPAQQWENSWPGIDICRLRDNANGRSYLMRMHPGSLLPAHTHGHDEESLLLEGEAWISGSERLTAGDYQFVPAGVAHPDIHSPGGCLVFVRSDPRFQPRITPGFIARFVQFTLRRWLG